MSMLTVEGFEITIVPGTRLQYVPHGDFGRAFSGTMRSDVRALHRGGHVSGTYLSTTNDAPVLVAILNSPGPLTFGGTLIGDDAYFHVRNVETVPITSDLLQISFDCMETDEAPSPLLFSFDADAPGTYTFTRASTGYYITSGGSLTRAGGNRARLEWLDLESDEIGRDTPTLLSSPQRINLVDSDDLTAWSVSGTPVVTGSIDSPSGATGAYRVEDDDGAVQEFVVRNVSFTGDGIKTVAFCVREATMPATGSQVLKLRDTTAGADRLSLGISAWVNGEPTVSASTGTLLGTRPVSNGYWLILARSTSVTAASTNRVEIIPAGTTTTGSIDVFRANAFNDVDVPSWTPLDASETLQAETWYAEFDHLQQPLSVYVKMVEGGTGFMSSGNGGVVHIGGAGGADDPRFSVYHLGAGGAGRYSCAFDNGIDAAVTADIASGGSVYGDVVELVAHLDFNEDDTADVQIFQSVNEGAAVTDTSTGPASGLNSDRAWDLTPARIHIGSRADGERGFNPIISVRVVAGIKTMDEMRHWAKARLHARISTDVVAPLSVSRTVSVAASASVSVSLTVA